MTCPTSGPFRLLVDDAPLDGAWNMALDRAIQLERAAGRSPATLRLYGWAHPTVSLGRFQDLDSVDVEECRSEGIDIVRRFTGGRGVLHDDEVTYSLVAGLEDGVPRGTTASYRFLCTALVETYRRLGVEADVTSRTRGARSSGACYLHATHADVSAGMRKLSGSAQVWHRDVALQHGSFVLARNIDREARVFRLTPDEARDLAATTATVTDLAAARPTRTDLVAVIAVAFERLFGRLFEPGSITENETAEAFGLMKEVDIASNSSTRARASA